MIKLWQDAATRIQPRRTLLVGPGADGQAEAALALSEAWGGLVDLAWPEPAEAQPPHEGSRFTLHRARPQDAAGLLPVPGLVVVEAGADGPTVTGLLHALHAQARRAAKPFPLVLLFGVTLREEPPGLDEEPRPPVQAALEDFVAAEAPALVFVTMGLGGGVAMLTGRAEAGRDEMRAVLAEISMGGAARRAAEQAEAERRALQAENAGLRQDLATARHREALLHAALRRAQQDASQAARQEPPAAAPRSLAHPLSDLPRRVVRKALSATGLRRGAGQPQDAAEAQIARLRRSKVLDAAWYHERYPDVAASGADAAEHYYRHGAAEGRDPGPDFSTLFYLAAAPDVARSGANPLLHFLDHGGREGRNPSADFDSAFYLDTYQDVREAGLNPLEHYLAQGREEGRRRQTPR